MENSISHICTIENLSGDHATMEMVLSSLFDNSFTIHEYGLKATNGQLEYKISKKLEITTMTVRIISLCKPKEKYTLSFLGKPFVLNKKSYEFIGLDIIDFTNCK